MSASRRLGVLLVVVGALVVVSSSGALVGSVAERSLAVDVANDRNAVVGLTYPAPGTNRVARLDGADADFGGWCFFGTCIEYYHTDVSLLVISDQQPSETLHVDQISYQANGDGITQSLGDDVPQDGMRRVYGTFACANQGGDQQAGRDTVAISATVASDNGSVEVTLDRTVDFECVPG